MTNDGLETYAVTGIDTPELRGEQREAGEAVKQVVIDWFREAGSVAIEFCARDKYAGRTVADFRPITRKAARLSEYLVQHGYAKRYDGGRKEPWTARELEAICKKVKR